MSRAGVTQLTGSIERFTQGIIAGTKLRGLVADTEARKLQNQLLEKQVMDFDAAQDLERRVAIAQLNRADAQTELTKIQGEHLSDALETDAKGKRAQASEDLADAIKSFASGSMTPDDIESHVQSFMDEQGIPKSEQGKVGPLLQSALGAEVNKLKRQNRQSQLQEFSFFFGGTQGYRDES